jgi:hypothetical protein
MRSHWLILAASFLIFSCAPTASAQVEDFPNIAGAPPRFLLLVRQEFRFGKAGERQKLEAAIARDCGQFSVPNSWIDLESITGTPGALFFDPFDSFEDLGNAFAEWNRIFSAHQNLARMQDEIRAMVTF